jgi:transcriptional regulator with XRE-family HTH domain
MTRPDPTTRRRLAPAPDPDPATESTADAPGVFSPGRLRAYRDLYGYTRVALADRVGLHADTVAAYEQGAATPDTATLAALATALNVHVRDVIGPPGADDSWEYWGLICAAMPPMTDDQIATVATVLRRIDQQHQHAHDGPPTKRPRAA